MTVYTAFVNNMTTIMQHVETMQISPGLICRTPNSK